MSQIRSKNTKPELLVRRFIFSHGFRFRIHAKNLPGKPDIVLPKYKVAILVHGCFWHAHKLCGKNALPKNNPDYWRKKLTLNVERDKVNKKFLKKMGWTVFEIWECQLSKKKLKKTLDGVLTKLEILRNEKGN